jgi:hypothetical protein
VGEEKMVVVLKGGSGMVTVMITVDDLGTSLELDGSMGSEDDGVGVGEKIGSEDSVGDGSGKDKLLLSEGEGTSKELDEDEGAGVGEKTGVEDGSGTGSLLVDGSGISKELDDNGGIDVGEKAGVDDGPMIGSLLLSDGEGTSNELDDDSGVGVGEKTGVEDSDTSELEEMTSDDDLDFEITTVEVTVRTVVFAVGGPLYPPDDFGGSVVLDGTVVGTMMDDELLKNVGMSGVEVELTVAVKVEGTVEGRILVPVPVPQVERVTLVRLP